VLFILISLIIGFSVGYFILESRIAARAAIDREIILAQEAAQTAADFEITELEEKITEYEEKINKLESSLNQYESNIAALDSEISNLKSDYKVLEEEYNQLLTLYKSLSFQENAYHLIDFTEYTETDNDNKINVTSKRISWVDFDRSKDRMVYKTYGKDFFSDFKHLLDFRIEEVQTGYKKTTIIDLWSLCGDETRYEDSNFIKLSAAQAGIRPDKFKIVFQQKENSEIVFDYHQLYNLSTGVTYYAVISRNDNLCQVQIYSDPERNNLVLDTGLRTGFNSKYSFLILARSKETISDLWGKSSGFVENLRLKT
jgi:cell division protein FtsB